MKKFLFILFIIVATKHQLIGQNYYNQHCPQPSGTMACQPNVSPLDSGFTPMPSHVNQIKKGIYFEETFTLQNYSNIDIPGAIFLDSLKFDSIFNLPTGLCWQTNDANDFFANWAPICIKISGITNDSTGQYTVKNSVQLYVNNDIFPVIEGSLTYLRVVEANDTNTYPIDSILGDNLDFIPYSSRPSNLPIITPVSNVGLCDGSLHLLAFGFRHPFTYHLGPYSNSSGYFNNLCEGAYDAYVIDNNNVSSDTAVVIINNSVNTTINSYSFGTDLPIDTHYINLNNCSFNYNATTDSGRITNITILPGNSNAAILTFEIWQNGVSSSYSDTLFAIRDSTLNMVNFVMYCDTNGRAVHGTLTLIDYFVKDSNGNLLLKIKDNDFSKNINLYPVPVDAELFVNMPIPFKELQLYDLTGKLLKQFSPNEKILVNDLSSGAYFISIVLNDGQKFFKTILKK